MRVFAAGATGAIGKQLVARLVGADHEVHGMTRSRSKRAMVHELGAVPVVTDALDPDQVANAVGQARPDVIVHELTALAGVARYSERDAAPADRLRTEATDYLLSALAQMVGAKQPRRMPRFIGRLLAGEAGVSMMTEICGGSNAKAKRELAWRSSRPSWRQGFAAA